MRLAIILSLCLCSVALADDKPVVVTCSITLTPAQYAALESEAANLSTPEAPVTVQALCAEWLLHQARQHAETELRNLAECALAAEATKPAAERPLTDAAVAAAVAVKAAAAVAVEPVAVEK
jgi:hypothetical protein